MPFRAELLSVHPPARLLDVVLNVASLPCWNDALSAVHTSETTARLGVSYRATVKHLIPASIVYDAITTSLVQYRLSACGNTERGLWLFDERPGGQTMVTHEMIHSGSFLEFMRGAFAPVPAFRLARLEARTASLEHFT